MTANLVHFWWEDKFVTTLESNLAVFGKGEDHHTYGQSIPRHSGYRTWRNACLYIGRYIAKFLIIEGLEILISFGMEKCIWVPMIGF